MIDKECILANQEKINELKAFNARQRIAKLKQEYGGYLGSYDSDERDFIDEMWNIDIPKVDIITVCANGNIYQSIIKY